jgi:hypothetical protein
MNFLSAFFTGIAVTASPSPQPAVDTQQVQVASVQTVPDFSVTPLTEADVDLYLHVMHGAADHVAHAGENRAALVNYDETVAEREGVKKRYDAVKVAVDARVADNAPTPLAEGQTEHSVTQADDALLAPHKDEILALQNQVHGSMNGR